MQKITPFLWFDNNAEDAMNYYLSVFKDSSVIEISHSSQNENVPQGVVFIVKFQLNGQEFMALNGGPYFKFNESFSIYVNCETQDEVDYLWERLSDGGEKSRCGWLKDKFGLSWQIVPEALPRLMGDKDPVKAKRVMDAMLQMDKLDTRILQQAYDGVS